MAFPYFAAKFLSTFALSIPHAILTPILLSKGLSLSEILKLQVAFSICVLLFEIPSGAIADIIDRRIVYVASRAILAIFFIAVMLGSGFYFLLSIWSIYGIANALESGTLDAALVNNAKNQKRNHPTSEGRVSWLVRRESQFNFSGMLFGSVTGAISYPYIGYNIYLFSFCATVLAIVSVVLFFHIPEQKPQFNSDFKFSLGKLKHHVDDTTVEMRQSPLLKRFLLLTVLIESFMQLHMQLWQAIALENSIGENRLFLLYATFIAISAFSSTFRAEKIIGSTTGAATVLLAVTVCIFSLHKYTGHLYVISYAIIVFFLIIFLNYCTIGVRRNSSIERIGSVTSLVSVCSRIGSITTLIISSQIIEHISATQVFCYGSALITVILTAFGLFIRLSRSS
ncbi:MFS transporter [Corynebacterium anserum]|uniref:MFS transporter n=1 Tax=Corynebacterium anserum TaxID=2684406 RepID=UPI00163ACA45|nr:MFS transporter [Corynebacterium anserum]MBC2681051.1 MFS transporter [Corynebacterium anserum]